MKKIAGWGSSNSMGPFPSPNGSGLINALPVGILGADGTALVTAGSQTFVSTDCPTFVSGNGYNYRALATDGFIKVTLNAAAVAAGAQQLVDLPTSGIPAGKVYMVKAATGATMNVTVQNTVDGNTNWTLLGTGEGLGGLSGNGVILVWDGVSSYWVVGSF
jgi:hypothetical protein